jgi:hypothetical protein
MDTLSAPLQTEHKSEALPPPFENLICYINGGTAPEHYSMEFNPSLKHTCCVTCTLSVLQIERDTITEQGEAFQAWLSLALWQLGGGDGGNGDGGGGSGGAAAVTAQATGVAPGSGGGDSSAKLSGDGATAVAAAPDTVQQVRIRVNGVRSVRTCSLRLFLPA